MSIAAPPTMVTFVAYFSTWFSWTWGTKSAAGRYKTPETETWFFFCSQYLTAMLAPTLALFLINSTFEAEDSPPVSSLTLFKRKGVIKAPAISYSSASRKA